MKSLVAPIRQGFADQSFGVAVVVDFSGVDQRQPKIDAEAKRRRFLGTRVGGAHPPGPLTQG